MQRVFLMGDNIRLGYDRYVREKLSGMGDVYFPSDNGRFAAYTLRYCDEWILREADPLTITVIHFNCGHWDIGRYAEDRCFTPLETYLDLLERIVLKLRRVCPRAGIVFATSTPVLEHRFEQPDRFLLRNEDILLYNRAAVGRMRAMEVQVNDLHAVAVRLRPSAWSDSTNLSTPEAARALGDSVSGSVVRASLFR